ncbi:DUF3800 domain-containing protein [uncultured Clostridium sp.]|uniref:DUF3800 domain-containing protein n=1 Tax=uncultured Clostridium sp. TaxID=59620 RepID=UPI002621B7C6|nr:DUF3800 domain-containing protein [uncultured Clostridium sp.]
MKYDIYCDESRQDLLVNKKIISKNNKYVCIGGILVSRSKRNELKRKIKKLKEKHNVFGELKWGTVSENKIQFYKEIVDLFFEFNDEVLFRTVVINSADVDNKMFNNNDAELGYYKFYYQLIYNWIELTGDSQSIYYIYTDFKTNKVNNRLEVMKNLLNMVCISSIKLIQAINSKESEILQMQNILMGAVGYKYNFGKDGKSKAKMAIVKHIEGYLGHSIRETKKNERKFNIFNIRLKNKGGK